MKAKAEGHLEAGEILASAEGRAVTHGARSHLERCPACRDAHAEAVTLVERMRTDRWPEPRAELVAAIAAWRRTHRQDDGVREELARRARSRRAASEDGVALRALPTAPTALRFTATGLVVDIELAVTAAARRVTGQALARRDAEPPLTVWAETPGRRWGETAVGEHGEFVLEGLSPGKIDIVLDCGQRRVRLRLPALGES